MIRPLRTFLPGRASCGKTTRPAHKESGLHFASLAVLLFSVLFFWPVPGVHAQGAGPRLPQPGFRSVRLWAPDIPIRMDIAVWYPSPRIPRDILLEGWSIHVGQNGVTTPGKYPVILLSHTTAASRLASHDLAAALARHGFMVIAPTHPGDNMDDTSGIFHAALFANRPNQLLLALETVEKHSILRQIMDRSRVGVLGVGAGAATALQLAGARPELARLNTHCRQVESIIPADPLCSEWATLFHPRMQTEFAELLARNPERLTPVMYPKDEPLASDASLNDLARAFARKEADVPAVDPESQIPTPELALVGPPPPAPPVVEEKKHLPPQPVLAVGLLTPGLVDLFPDAVLQNITAPVGILAVADDGVYPAEKSVDRLQKLLPQRPASRVLQGAGHQDVQAPCPPVYLESFPALCGGEGGTVEDARTIRNEFFVRFFQKTLGTPGPPPLLPSR